MPSPKLIVYPEGIDFQFRLKPEDDEIEEGQIDDDSEVEEEEEDGEDEEDEEEEENKDNNKDDEEQDGGISDNKDSQTKQDNELNKNGSGKSKRPRMSLFELQSFLVALLLPEPRLSTPPKWCRVLRCMRASNAGIFLLDNVDIDWITDKASKFTHAFRFETVPNWIERLTSVPLSRRVAELKISSRNDLQTGYQFETNLNAPYTISKKSLLLSPLQMIVEGYPMPTDEGIQIIRSKYYPVDDRSPIFAVDCEMCITDRSELTRVSIVDEESRVLYDELVKPRRQITNYLTRYSGITEEMMEKVTNTLEDVHYFLRHKLPRDSILCGHSLNMDLIALRMFHPYVIDTSVIYNRSGNRSHKPSLKSLVYEFMNKEIQTRDRLGHDSTEDAGAAMDLVKLKLINGEVFGDAVAYEVAQGYKYDSKTGITHLPIDKFINRHEITPLSYRVLDTTPGARCMYVHDTQNPLDEEVKETVLHLLEKSAAICVVLTGSGECYVKI